MKIVVIDGQGGRMGSAFIDKWIKSGGDPKELIAVGTNAMATSAMMKAGAVKAATGENPVVVNTSGADFVVGPIGIIAADEKDPEHQSGHQNRAWYKTIVVNLKRFAENDERKYLQLLEKPFASAELLLGNNSADALKFLCQVE